MGERRHVISLLTKPFNVNPSVYAYLLKMSMMSLMQRQIESFSAKFKCHAIVMHVIDAITCADRQTWYV